MSGGNSDGGGGSRLSTLMRASPVVLYTMAPDNFGSMTWVSDNMAAVTGWPGELVADDPHWLEHNIHPDDYAVVTEALTAWVAAGAAERLQIEYRQRTRDGEWRWYEDQVAAVRDERGGVVELVGSIQDITVRKSAERDRDRLLSILEATPDFISMAKPDGTITYINRGGLATLGLDTSRTGLDRPLPDEVVDDRAGHLAHPEWASRLIHEEGLPTALKHGVWQGETAYIDGRGREVPTSQVILGHRDEHGELEYFSTIIRDISAQQDLEQQLRGEKAFSDAILRNLPGVFYMLDAEGRFRRWNEPLEVVTGHVGDALAEVSPLELFLEGERELVAERIQQVFDAGTAEVEGHLCHRDGGCRPYFLTGYRVELDGEPYLLGVGLDVGELETVRQELERSNTELEQFAYAVSHDLQEPLRVISSYLTLLVRRLEGRLEEKERHYVDTAVQGAERMSQMIQGLLSYSRIQRHGEPMGPVDLNAVVDEARANLRTAEFESGARLEVGKLPGVLGDAGQLSRLFQNLIGNALKYRRAEVEPRITIGAEPFGGEWLIRIADNGIGIDPEQCDRVFQVFQRLHARDEYEGNGLGLALAQRIVSRHGGAIGVESAGEGHGSTFWLTLPMPDGASAP